MKRTRSGLAPQQVKAPEFQRGLAPQRINPISGGMESMELHHIPAQRDGGLFDVNVVRPDDHMVIDPFRRIGK